MRLIINYLMMLRSDSARLALASHSQEERQVAANASHSQRGRGSMKSLVVYSSIDPPKDLYKKFKLPLHKKRVLTNAPNRHT